MFAIPAGTELTLIAEAFTDDNGNVSDNDRIAKATAKPISGKFPGMVYVDGKPTEQPVPLEIVNNGEAFRIEFKDKFRLMDNVKFEVTFVNKYDIVSRRLISIQVVQDQPPVVEVAVETIRRVGNVYLVTSKARIPFNPDSFVKDDHGLSNVQYVFEYAAEDSDFVRAYRTTLGLRTLLEVPLPGTTRTAETALRYMKNFHEMDKAENQEKRSAGVSEFRNQWNRLRRDSRKVFDDLLPVTKVEDFPQQLNDPLAKAFPERQPTDRVLWVGDARNPKVFWLGDPRSPMAGRLTKPNDPQSAEKFPIANTNRGAMLAELREKDFASAADFDHWYGELQTVKKV